MPREVEPVKSAWSPLGMVYWRLNTGCLFNTGLFLKFIFMDSMDFPSKI